MRRNTSIWSLLFYNRTVGNFSFIKWHFFNLLQTTGREGSARVRDQNETSYDCQKLQMLDPTQSNIYTYDIIRSGSHPSGDQAFRPRMQAGRPTQGHVLTSLTTLGKLICDVCGRKFAYSWQITRHKRCHTGERPFACSMCTADFARKDTLSRHVMMVHNA